MQINRDNYEAYFIDYLEGNLDETLVNDFIEFIRQNPDLKDEMELFNSISLEPENIQFNNKYLLYKEKFDAEKEFNQAAIARMEGDLTDEEKSEFKDYLERHPEKQKEAALFNHTKLQPDESIVFRNKKKLYHHSAGRTVLLWGIRIAAVLVLALAVYWYMDNTSENNPENKVAVIKESPVEKAKSLPEKRDEPSEEIKKIPVEKNESSSKETIKNKEIKQEPVKEVQPKPMPKNKSLRENSKGRMEHDLVATVRTPVEAPQKIKTFPAKVEVSEPGAALAAINYRQVEPENVEENRLIGDIVKEKAGLNNLSLNKITKAGLQLVSSLSKENLSYETNKNGNITEVNFDSRLLAFSIPTNTQE